MFFITSERVCFDNKEKENCKITLKLQNKLD